MSKHKGKHKRIRMRRKPKSVQQWLNDLFHSRDDAIAAAIDDLLNEDERDWDD
jgi:hypothetical protein